MKRQNTEENLTSSPLCDWENTADDLVLVLTITNDWEELTTESESLNLLNYILKISKNIMTHDQIK